MEINALDATSVEAPPPNPFNDATNCGIAVIGTFTAVIVPISAPKIIPIIIIS